MYILKKYLIFGQSTLLLQALFDIGNIVIDEEEITGNGNSFRAVVIYEIENGKIVIEVEAGRATENNQYMKDIFQACMMFEVEYLVVAVRNTYRGHKDFNIVYTFLETLYISSRLHLPLKGILLIGY